MTEVIYYPEVGVADAASPRKYEVSEDWATIRGAASGTNVFLYYPYGCIFTDTVTDKWHEFGRGIICFNSTGKPTDIQSAKVRLDGLGRINQFATGTSLGLYLSTPTNPANIAVGDYSKVGSVLASDITLDVAAGVNDAPGWVEFPLNATGLAAIVDGISKFGIRLSWDVSNNPPTWVSYKFCSVYFSGLVGSFPQLVITYTPMEVTTDPATYISQNGATLNGTLIEDANDTPVTCSFQYGLTTNYELGDNIGQIVVAESTSWATVVGLNLIPGTTYHFRAKAVGASGATVYGADRTFGTAVPSESQVRVSSLVHRWSPGNYSLEVIMGGLSAKFVSPVGSVTPTPTIPPTPAPIPAPAPGLTWSGPFYDAFKASWYWLRSDGYKLYFDITKPIKPPGSSSYGFI